MGRCFTSHLVRLSCSSFPRIIEDVVQLVSGSTPIGAEVDTSKSKEVEVAMSLLAENPKSSAPAWRRIAAYFVDYFAFMVPLLALLSLGAWVLFQFEVAPTPESAWLKHGIMLVLLTFPIVLYFALCESSNRQATLGKRLMHVAVVNHAGERASLSQATIRAVVKFLPWELFHAIYWHWEGWPTNPVPATTLQITGLAIGWIAVACYLGSLFIPPRRTPYDWLAGTAVVRV